MYGIDLHSAKLCLGLLFFLAWLSPGLRAQQCSTRTTAGCYKVICDGFLTVGPNTPLVPAKELATATAYRNGTITSTDGKISLGGSFA